MITWITPNLAIGSKHDSRALEPGSFSAVLNVAIDLDIKDAIDDVHRIPFKRHKVGLLDGPGNSHMVFMSAVLMLDSLVRDNAKVLIHCHEGKSRSVMVTATWLHLKKLYPEKDFDTILREIIVARGVDHYRPALYELAKRIMTYQPFLILLGQTTENHPEDETLPRCIKI